MKLRVTADDGTVLHEVDVPADYAEAVRWGRTSADLKGAESDAAVAARLAKDGVADVVDGSYRREGSLWWDYHLDRTGLTPAQVREDGIKALVAAPAKPKATKGKP